MLILKTWAAVVSIAGMGLLGPGMAMGESGFCAPSGGSMLAISKLSFDSPPKDGHVELRFDREAVKNGIGGIKASLCRYSSTQFLKTELCDIKEGAIGKIINRKVVPRGYSYVTVQFGNDSRCAVDFVYDEDEPVLYGFTDTSQPGRFRVFTSNAKDSYFFLSLPSEAVRAQSQERKHERVVVDSGMPAAVTRTKSQKVAPAPMGYGSEGKSVEGNTSSPAR